MKKTLVLTLIGKDQIGLVERLSLLVVEHQGRWLESQFSRLGETFAGILQVSVPTDQVAPLEAELRAMAGQGLRVVIEEGRLPASEPCYPLSLRFVGQDRSNIVAEISEVLSRFKVTVQSLKSRCASAPMSGELLFHADFEVQVPLSISCDRLSEALEALTPELMVDLDRYQVRAV